MPDRIVYVTRLTRVSLIGADGADIGRIVDVVIDLGKTAIRDSADLRRGSTGSSPGWVGGECSWAADAWGR